MDKREKIARRIAREITPGMVVNLGIGLPTLVADYIPRDVECILQTENGILGVGPSPAPEQADKDYFNAGGALVTLRPGACFLESAACFGLMRGGHLDLTVLGALEVDEQGSLANWLIPGKWVPGMGGAMDLVYGSRRVILAMEHVGRQGQLKLRRRCTLPLTAVGAVHRIVTDLAVIDVTPDGFLLHEVADGVTPDDVQRVTEAELRVAGDLGVF